MLCVVVLAVFPVTVAAVVHEVPLVLVWMLKSRVFQETFSPPEPACFTMNWLTVWLEPRSTCSHLVAPDEHHLSALPPPVLPLTALSGPSVVPQELSAVAALPSARLVGGGVVAP